MNAPKHVILFMSPEQPSPNAPDEYGVIAILDPATRTWMPAIASQPDVAAKIATKLRVTGQKFVAIRFQMPEDVTEQFIGPLAQQEPPAPAAAEAPGASHA